MLSSSNWLGHHSLKVGITDSNSVGSTKSQIDMRVLSGYQTVNLNLFDFMLGSYNGST